MIFIKIRHIFKRIISFLLCFSLLLSFGICGASASDGGAVQQFDTLAMPFTAVLIQEGSTVITDQFTRFVHPGYGTYKPFLGCTAFEFPVDVYKLPGKKTVKVNVFDNFKVRPDHEYNFVFDYGFSFALPTTVTVKLSILNSDNSIYKILDLFTSPSNTVANKLYNCDFNFKVKSTDLPDGYRCNLYIELSQSATGSSVNFDPFFILSRYATLTDLDDDSGWFQKILDAIKAIPQNIKQFFENLGAKISELGDRIGSWFSDLGKSIGGFFSDLWKNLQQSFKDIGQWFKDLGDRIQGFFVDLYNDIIDGLKRLFIPSEGYFNKYADSWKQWASEHLGIIYQLVDLSVSVLEKIGNLFRDDFVFTFPEISLTLDGKKYVFVNEQLVNMSQWLASGSPVARLYEVYTMSVWFILVFCLIQYGFHIERIILDEVV